MAIHSCLYCIMAQDGLNGCFNLLSILYLEDEGLSPRSREREEDSRADLLYPISMSLKMASDGGSLMAKNAKGCFLSLLLLIHLEGEFDRGVVKWTKRGRNGIAHNKRFFCRVGTGLHRNFIAGKQRIVQKIYSKSLYAQPPGFRDSVHPDYVCLLQRSLYELKQASRAWFQRFASYITWVGFSHSRCDSLFIYRQRTDTAYLLLYVDDIVLTASSEGLLQRIIHSLHQEFAMTNLGPINYFLGIYVTRDSSGLFLSQKKYAVEILEKTHMVNCNPSWSPVDTESKLGVDGDPVSDPTLYRSLASSLQYLTFTRPDISYAVQQVCLHMHDPREPYLSALKRILRYAQGTLHYGLQLFSSSTTDLVAFSDADWAGCPTTRRSTSGYCVFLGNNLLSWSSKRQPTLSRSSTEAEYRGVVKAVAETCWLRNLLRELHTPLSSATFVYCDNVSAVYLSCNPVQRQRTKHIEIDIHFVRDLVDAGQVRVLHVPSRYQFADIFTKGLSSALFEEFRSSLSVRCPPAQTTGEC
ncbi:ribonuclease H-like domain-containing protein [Tanacetum coccineum]|uniref:Ribonuclease H-like domain-containing protein n=1 Tax=Tanacetum coccineum TaxID=301880 RepID=A0ABQ5EJ18_9ASTR